MKEEQEREKHNHYYFCSVEKAMLQSVCKGKEGKNCVVFMKFIQFLKVARRRSCVDVVVNQSQQLNKKKKCSVESEKKKVWHWYSAK